MNNIASEESLRSLFRALDDQLELLDAAFELVVIGGAGLIALRASSRATRDVDVVAIQFKGELERIDEMPEPLRVGVEAVAADFGVDSDWLNAGPTELLRFGLPEGFPDRMGTFYEGRHLIVRMASREDQIHFKLYALADRGPGKHEHDLELLNPTDEELLRAARWTRTHDPSEEYLSMLTQALEHLGVTDAADRI